MKKGKEEGKHSWVLILAMFALAIFLVTFVWFKTPYIIDFLYKFTCIQGEPEKCEKLIKMEERGQFGDQFGAVNALFSGLAFACLITAIFLQWAELKLQRKDFNQSLYELKKQGSQLTEQNKILEKQNFQTSFFQHMSMYQKCLETLSYFKPAVNKKGQEFINHVAGEIKCEGIFDDSNIQIKMFEKYRSVYENNQRALDTYFHFLQDLIVSVQDRGSQDEDMYIRIIKAQLLPETLTILFYQGLMRDWSKLKELVEKHGFLERIFVASLHTEESSRRKMVRLYDASAYGGEYPDVKST